MATHDVDRKILSRLARDASASNRELSSALYQILGLSKMLSRRLLRARKLRRLDSTDEKAMTLFHHIIWMSREGLKIVEEVIARYAETNHFGVELKIFAYKLRASFYHVFCLFHNKPSVSQLNPAGSPKGETAPTVLLPVPSNRQARPGFTPPRDGNLKDPNDPSPPSRAPTGLRDSILSDTSNVTNPFGSVAALSPPPGLQPHPRDPAAFLLPSTNFVPLTITSFENAADLASHSLSGSSPLRLSIALEYSAFKWDCLHDHPASRRLAKHTIRAVYDAQEGMDDAEFHDAAVLVGTLGRMMRRSSEERTPRFAPDSPPRNTGPAPQHTPPPVPAVPRISPLQEQALRQEARQEEERARRKAGAQQLQKTPPRPTTRSAIHETETTPEVVVTTPDTPVTVQQAYSPRPTTAEDKPLPDLPVPEPGFHIPRRAVGTPPSRPRTAGKETVDEGRNEVLVNEEMAQERGKGKGKRKNEEESSPRSVRSLIPRLRGRNPS